MSAPIVQVQCVSKRYCRNLTRSLWYGVKDIAGEFVVRRRRCRPSLRPAEFWALDDVSFELGRGQCLGLIGPNGSGKSTLLKLVSGLVKPDYGTITVRGKVGALIELGAGFHSLLTGRENIFVNGSILGLTTREIRRRLDEIIDFAEIGDAIDSPVQTYSSGMRARLGFAIAAHLNPDLLLIDEVLAVGDISFRAKCMNLMFSLLGSGMAAIFVTHSLYQLQAVTTQALLLDSGKVVLAGPPTEVVDAYEQRFADERRCDVPGSFRGLSFKGLSINDSPVQESLSHVSLQTGDPVEIALTYEVHRKIESGVQIGLLIKTLDGHNVGGFTTNVHGSTLSGDPGVYTLKIKIARLPLLQGNFEIGFSGFNGAYTEHLAAWNRACTARVKTAGYNGLHLVGTTLIDHTTSIAMKKM